MMSPDAETIGRELARCRKRGEVATMPVAAIAADEAEEIQRIALEDFSDDLKGYSIQPASGWLRRLIGADAPVWCPLARQDFIAAGARFKLPYGILGAGVGFAFIFGRAFPALHDDVRPSLEDAIVSCVPMIQILGRRLGGSVPLDRASATADFGLNAAIILGAPLVDWRQIDPATTKLRIIIDDQEQPLTGGDDAPSRLLGPVLQLSSALRRRGAEIEAGEIVAAGVRTGLAQILPGQTLRVECDGRPAITLTLA